MRSAAPRIEAHYQHYRTAVEPKLEGKADDCPEWTLQSGEVICSLENPQAVAVIPGRSLERDVLFDVRLGNDDTGIILYADVTSPTFGPIHQMLATTARTGGPSYRLRYRRIPKPTEEPEPLPLSGYGVELVLKRTDYIVIDDRGSEKDKGEDESAQKPQAAGEVVLNGDEDVSDLKPLSASELEELGLKAADFILHSDKPFDMLLKLTQDFPRFSNPVSKHNVSEGFRSEHYANHMQLLQSGQNVLWMNGMQLLDRQIQSFGLVDVLRKERKLINEVRALGLSGKDAVDLLSHSAVASAKADDEPPRFDWTDQTEEGKAIIWMNNLEKDKRYDQYSPSLMALLSGGMPGQLPPCRKDIHNIILPVDLAQKADRILVVSRILDLVKQRIPIRFGLVPLTATPESAQQAKVAYYLLRSYGLASLISYIEATAKVDAVGAPDQGAFDAAIQDRPLRSDAEALSLAEVLASEPFASQVALASKWASRLGANSAVPPLFVNGLAIPRDAEGKWMSSMSNSVMGDLRTVQQGIYYQMIGSDTWVPSLFLENAAARRNRYIFPEDGKSLTILDVNKIYTEHDDLFSRVVVVDSEQDAAKDTWALLTVVSDLESKDGRELLLSALRFRAKNPGVRLDVVHNPVWRTSQNINSNLKEKTQELLAAESEGALAAILDEVANSPQINNGLEYAVALERFLKAAAIQPTESMLLLNGRMVGPIASAAEFKEDDFKTLLDFEKENRILPVYKALEDLGLGDKLTDPVAAAKLTSLTALSTISDVPEGAFETPSTLRISSFNIWNSTHTAFEVGDPAKATIFFTAIIDPASELGQKWAPLLKVLSELEGVHLKVFLNPKDKLEELPVKRFYRFVMESTPKFDKSGKLEAPAALFKGLPSEALLNLGMDVPPAWLVAPKVSIYDPDNIKLSSVGSDVKALYELEHILIEGHARDPKGTSVRGVQLVLGTESNAHLADTLIMANLGFFQFKANPGLYKIQIEQGRSSELFYLESIGAHGFAPVAGDESAETAVLDFLGTTLYPRLRRNPGMEELDVLGDGTASAASKGAGAAMDLVNKGLKFAESLLGGGKDKQKVLGKPEQAEINIFSVASGHLYERMLNIMMVSVMRHTKHTVKFWFIEQFLSPSFKDFIPHMAAEYGFQYEMVTYKWPHWLRQQKEKQREIWGYKILFLDVLFPLSLDKVIFVDADQVVRADMYELVTLDLQGAPYGFTPMCDSRTEMEGFRFWKQGYWERYLKGLPYHISALYVVDLRRFRELAAGDRLRQTYHSLSADPQSLSNLDQDLPNHMQFSIPIHSLPQEWLWCETWCSDESLPAAKTIDLCNNPQTKEPKLDRARRQVPEWSVYDAEIAALDRRRKGLPPLGESGDGGAKADKNPKSRALEGEEAVAPPGEKTHVVDEL